MFSRSSTSTPAAGRSGDGVVARLVETSRRVPGEAACLVLVFSAYCAYLLSFGSRRFYWDAAEYWRLGGQFDRTGHFSLYSYTNPYRGYALPLAAHVLKVLAVGVGMSGVTAVELAGAALAAVLGVSLLPRVARALFSEASVGWGRVLVLNALVFAYWRGHFNYPLTDFPALALACLGLLALLRRSAFGYLAAGVCFGLAANLRPAYVPALAVAALVTGLRPLLGEWGRRALAVVLVLLGALIASLPQMAVNHHSAGTWKPTLRGAHDISLVQLSGGLVAQRYETFVGPRRQYPRAKVFYVDPAGSRVLREEAISGVSGYVQYLRIVVRHPLLMAGSYGLHLFDGLDVWYPTPYVTDLNGRSSVLSLLQYSLLFLALVRLVGRRARERLGRVWWAGIAVLLSPCVLPIVGAVEPRFFLPVYALVYTLVCFGPELRASVVPRESGRRVALACAYGAFVLLCFAVSSATWRQSEHPVAAGRAKPTQLQAVTAPER